MGVFLKTWRRVSIEEMIHCLPTMALSQFHDISAQYKSFYAPNYLEHQGIMAL